MYLWGRFHITVYKGDMASAFGLISSFVHVVGFTIMYCYMFARVRQLYTIFKVGRNGPPISRQGVELYRVTNSIEPTGPWATTSFCNGLPTLPRVGVFEWRSYGSTRNVASCVASPLCCTHVGFSPLGLGGNLAVKFPCTVLLEHWRALI